jgi:hypothetical protein
VDSNGSFYQNGLPISPDNGGVGNVPSGAPAPKTAESSFYLSGSVYNTLINSDALLAEIEADLAAAEAAALASQASNVASGASAVSSAASAAAAAASLVTLLTTALLKANNLSDLADVPTAKINLALVKGDVGLGNVDNTSDVNKPVSTAQAAADALKANIASPTFTGVPAAPTAAPATNTTQLATTAFVEAARVILAAATALKANIASPTFTGVPAAPTAAPATNTTQIATTAFVEAARVILAAADALKAPIASPTLTGVPAAPTAAPGTNTTQLATTAFVEAARVILAAADALKAPIASPTLTGVPAAPTASVGTNTTQLATTAFVLANSSAGAPSAPQGRLTLTSGVAVMGTSVAGASSVLYTQSVGKYCPIYNGTSMVPTAFPELTNVLSDATKNPAAAAATKVYDLYVWDDGGTLRLGRSPAWTSISVRGYTHTMVDGFILNTSAITNGPAALRGTWVGTIATNAAATVDFIYGGPGPVAAVFNVWNTYNRVNVGCTVIDTSTAAYTLTSSTWRQSHANTANKISFVVGSSDQAVTAFYTNICQTLAVASGHVHLGIGYDNITLPNASAALSSIAAQALYQQFGCPITINAPAPGTHYFAAMESSDNSNAHTFNLGGTASIIGLDILIQM